MYVDPVLVTFPLWPQESNVVSVPFSVEEGPWFPDSHSSFLSSLSSPVLTPPFFLFLLLHNFHDKPLLMFTVPEIEPHLIKT